MDAQIVHWLNSWAGHWPTLDRLADLIANGAPLLYGILFLYIWFAFGRHNIGVRLQLVRGVLATAIALLVGGVVAVLWFRPRPFVTEPGIHLVFPHAADKSFPSDHGTGTFGLALGTLGIRPWISWAAMLLSVLTMVARVYSGVHYPTDMLAAMACAMLGHGVMRVIWPYVEPLLRTIVQLYERVETWGLNHLPRNSATRG